jgi:thioredoxin-like negative regulator of GroEL
MAIFKDGEVVEQLVGVRPEEELKEALDTAIGE